jgi:hydrogenase nickel incorporation protein HypA/HybF
MHELGIIFHIIHSIEEVGAENNLTRVMSVTLEVGEVSAIVPEYLTDCWRWAADKTELLKGAELKYETLPAVTYCESCGQSYSTVKHAKICPYCGSEETYLVTGREVNIKEIEAM